MSKLSLILLAAGEASRFGLATKKQWLRSGTTPLWLKVARNFQSLDIVDEVIVVASAAEIAIMPYFDDSFIYVKGGSSRQESLLNGTKAASNSFVMSHDVARACVDSELLYRLWEHKEQGDCIVPAIKATDTTYYDAKPLDRDLLLQIQTPQLSNKSALIEALEQNEAFSDDSSAIASIGKKVYFVEGSKEAHKLTYASDLERLECLAPPSEKTHIGFGFDTHPFCENKQLFLCGVCIEESYGFLAHSDGDVAIHAIIDALLGAAGIGDIGELFPDNDAQYKGIDSTKLLHHTATLIGNIGHEIDNIDITIVAQKPRIGRHKLAMRKRLSEILAIAPIHINIKATTSEKLGFIGRAEGVSVHAVAQLSYFNPNRPKRDS